MSDHDEAERRRVDTELKAFLKFEKDKRDKGYTNEKILEAVQSVTNAVSELQATSASHGMRLTNLESFVARFQSTHPTPKAFRSLPPMRPPSDSSLDLMVKTRDQISGEYQKLARETPGGSGVILAPPDKLTAIAEKAVTEAFKERQRREDETRLQAFDAAEADRKKRNRHLVYVFLGAIAAAAGTWTFGKAAGVAEGHTKGIIEGRSGIGVQAPSSAATMPEASPRK